MKISCISSSQSRSTGLFDALIVWKCSNLSIFFDTPKAKCSTCSLMSSRKASLLHPSANSHDYNCWNSRKEHCHGSTRSNRMESYIILCKTKDALSHDFHDCPKSREFDKKLQIFESGVVPGIFNTRLTIFADALTNLHSWGFLTKLNDGQPVRIRDSKDLHPTTLFWVPCFEVLARSHCKE